MAGSAATTKGNKIMPNGDVVSPDGEILERGTPEPSSEAEIEAAAIANADAEADPEMLELLNREPVAWRPETGDKLIGTVVGRYTREESDFGPYEVLEIRTASGVVIAWHAFGTVGRNAIARRNPREGDRIGVTKLGEVESKVRGHQPYANYHVVVKKRIGDGTMAPTGNSGGTAIPAEPANADWSRL